MDTDDSKHYIISGAPQCPFPDAFLGPSSGSALGGKYMVHYLNKNIIIIIINNNNNGNNNENDDDNNNMDSNNNNNDDDNDNVNDNNATIIKK